MRISFLLLLVHALLFTQVVSAASADTKLKGALLKAMKTHDTSTVKSLAGGGHESIDNDYVLQEKIYEYLEEERMREQQAKEQALAAEKAAEEKAKADVVANKNAEVAAAAAAVAAKKAAEEKKKSDALAAKKAKENKVKADAVAKQNAEKKAAAAAIAAKKAAEDKKKKDALAAKKAKENKARQAKAAEKKRKDVAAAKKKAAAQKQAKAKKAAAKKKAAPKKKTVVKAAPKAKAVPKAAAVVAVPVVAITAAPETPLSVTSKELVGTWKQISSEKVITLLVEEDTSFMLEQVEDDGTLTIMGNWKHEENIFMLSIKKVQRNVHTRDTNIHRIYKVDRLSKHRLVLRDKRNRIAYDLKR